MKIYIVMGDHSEYHDCEYYPEAVFTNRKLAEKFCTVDTCYWGDDEIVEVDIEVADKIWVVTSEEAYGSGAVVFREAFATEEEAEAYAKEINDDEEHEHTTLYNAKVREVEIDTQLDWLEEEYYKRIESSHYRNKFNEGDKVRLMTLDEILNMEGVEYKKDEFGDYMVLYTKYHAKVWIHLNKWFLPYLGKSFVVERTLGDCVEVPRNICYLQDWLFVKEEENE